MRRRGRRLHPMSPPIPPDLHHPPRAVPDLVCHLCRKYHPRSSSRGGERDVGEDRSSEATRAERNRQRAERCYESVEALLGCVGGSWEGECGLSQSAEHHCWIDGQVGDHIGRYAEGCGRAAAR